MVWVGGRSWEKTNAWTHAVKEQKCCICSDLVTLGTKVVNRSESCGWRGRLKRILICFEKVAILRWFYSRLKWALWRSELLKPISRNKLWLLFTRQWEPSVCVWASLHCGSKQCYGLCVNYWLLKMEFMNVTGFENSGFKE